MQGAIHSDFFCLLIDTYVPTMGWVFVDSNE